MEVSTHIESISTAPFFTGTCGIARSTASL